MSKLLDALAAWVGRGIEWRYFAVNASEWLETLYTGAWKYRITATAYLREDGDPYGVRVTGWEQEEPPL